MEVFYVRNQLRVNNTDENGDFVYVPRAHGLAEIDEEVPDVAQGDTFTVPPRGFVAVRIADNPGVGTSIVI